MKMEGFDTPDKLIEIEDEFTSFIPEDFLYDPIGYFEREGRNVKSGEKKYDETGRLREDPTAVKDLPIWRNPDGEELHVIGKRINTQKGEVSTSSEPFYEYHILEKLKQLGLPAARPVAKIRQGGDYLVVMERIDGIRWSERAGLDLKERGYTEEDIERLLSEANDKMLELKNVFEHYGIYRKWKLKDMVFRIDMEERKIISLIPTDWERTIIKT